jgi:hypothetical protein
MANNIKNCLNTGNEAVFLLSHSLKYERYSYLTTPNLCKFLCISYEEYKKKRTVQTFFSGFRPFKYALLNIPHLYFILGVEIEG